MNSTWAASGAQRRTLLIFRAMGLPLLGLLMSCMPDRWPRSTLSLPAAATMVTPRLMAYAIALQTRENADVHFGNKMF